MISCILRHGAWAALLAAAITPACSNNQAPPKALVKAYLQGSSTGTCPFASQQKWLEVGVETGLDPTLVADGNSQAGGQVVVVCQVQSNGSGFNIALSAELMGGLSGASISISSNSPVTSMGGMGITGTFEGMNGLHFTSNNCTLKYTYENGAVPDSTPIAPGRIWAHVSCLDAQSTLSTIGADGGMAAQQCDAEADIIFENCGT